MGNKINKMVFHPPQPPNYKTGSTTIWLKTESKEDICVIFMDRKAEFTVILSHTNAEDVGDNISYYGSDKLLLKTVNLCFYDYPGYGHSTGVPTEKGIYESTEAVYLYLRDQLGLNPEKLIAFGRSLGTAAACHLAYKYPLKGIILMSPMLSIYRICFPIRYNLPGDIFCNIKKIPYIKCNIHIIHGTEDEIVPFHHSIELYRLSNATVTFCWVEGGNHNNLDQYEEKDFTRQLLKFIERLKEDEYSRIMFPNLQLS